MSPRRFTSQHLILYAIGIAICMPSLASAWFDGGHRVVAALAWRQLSGERQSELAELLSRHPRFAEDFTGPMPRVLRNDANGRGSYLLQIASVWPDTARDYDGELRLRFDRPRWHYIEWPVFTDADSMGILNSRLPSIPFDDPGGIDHPLLNAVQAVRNSRSVLADPNAPDELKAVHVCWVAHLVGDLHQPCHAASIYSKSMYRSGNKGGNWTPVEPGENVHLFWDALLGSAKATSVEDLRRVESRAAELAGRPEFPELAAAAREETRVLKWAAESHELAKEVVYTPDLVNYLRRMEADGVKSIDLPPFALDDAYQQAARVVAERRVIEASARLAEVLSM